MGLIDDYKKVARLGGGNVIAKYPKAYFPKVTDVDYRRGYITRYFVKLKANKDSTITEVKEQDYKKYANSDVFNAVGFFQTVALRWKITGTREEVIMGNTRIVDSKETLMKGLSIKLSNRIQFMK